MQLYYKDTPVLVDFFVNSAKFLETYFGNVCKRLLPQITIFGVYFRQVSGFYYVDNCFTYICF